MGKRKADGQTQAEDVDMQGSGSEEDEGSVVNVDFEWFDPQPDIDFHGLKALLRQLFDVDNQLFDLSALADLIMAQPLLGSTVKCDGLESDPYAFFTAINMHQHRDAPVVKQLRDYLLDRAGKAHNDIQVKAQLDQLLKPDSDAQLGLILTERLINMPHQIVPPLYNMLEEEIQLAAEEKEPHKFSHYLVVSKAYEEVASQLGSMESRPQKKKKQQSGGGGGGDLFYFHPEDEALQKHAMASCSFDYSQPTDEGVSDSKRAFQELGVKPCGTFMLIEGSKFSEVARTVGEYLGSEA